MRAALLLRIRLHNVGMAPRRISERLRDLPAEGPSAAVGRLAALAAGLEPAELTDAWAGLWRWLAETPGAHRRLDQASAALAADEELRLAVQGASALLIEQLDTADLLGCSGLPSERGFLAEAADRLSAKILPRPRDDDDLGLLLRRMFPDTEAVAWLRALPPARLWRLVRLLAPPRRVAALPRLRRAVADGFRLLAVRVQAQGLARNLRRRGAEVPVEDSPFFRLTRRSLALADAWDEGGSGDADAWRIEVAACRVELGRIHDALGPAGVSVDVVYGIEVLRRCLERMELLVGVMAPEREAEARVCLRRLAEGLVEVSLRDRSLRHLAAGSLRLLHQRIVQRAGDTGEHYVASDRREYRQIWLRAAGGGLLTSLTAAVKVAIGALHHAVGLAPAATGLLYGLNYAGSFLLLQRWDLILATKQPAMTAAHLATVMSSVPGEDERDELIIDMAARICHSQVAAAIANVALVAAGAFAVDALWLLLTGRHWVSPAEAQAIYTNLSPVNSGTVFYAVLTGIILWASSMIGGWVDNWSAWNRLPQGIADHPLGSRWGRSRMQAIAASWRANLAAWATSISLGLMLGFTPAIGEVLGIPLDVRHVTLNTGILSLACAGLEGQWWSGGFFLLALSGIAVMFVLNLGVSFALSLYTALRSYEVGDREILGLARRLIRRLWRRPREFLLPVGLPARADAH